MKIKLRKFGEILTSRQDGREALAAIRPQLKDISETEMVEIDFEGVATFTPSWADEVRAGESFPKAIERIGSSERTLVVSDIQKISASATVPRNVVLRFVD